MSKKITLLGSTGSIGTQSLDVIRAQGYESTAFLPIAMWKSSYSRSKSSTRNTSA